MYAVIFTAEIRQLDEQYASMAQRLRERAMSEYGCLDFTACTEGDREIAISYWQHREQIQAWKNDPEHLRAQQLGLSLWYRSCEVRIAELIEPAEVGPDSALV